MINPLPKPRLLCAALLLAALAGCRPAPPPVMESTVANHAVRVEVGAAVDNQLPQVAGAAIALMTETLSDLDATRAGSDLHKLNRVASSVRLQVARETFRLIDLAHHYGALTGGAFDMTAAPLEEVWGLGAGGVTPEEEPADTLLEGIRAGVGHDHVQISDQGAVAFTAPNTKIGFRLLAPAYALDLAVLDLRRRGFSSVSVQLGGVRRVLGMRSPAEAWSADLPHPYTVGDTIGQVSLGDSKSALAVVRLYERTMRFGERTYGHILDPRSGRPAEGTVLAAVLAPSATMAQALAQALLVLGVEGAPEVLRDFPKCEALIMPDQRPEAIWATPGFAARLVARPALASRVSVLEVPVLSPVEPAEEPAPAPDS